MKKRTLQSEYIAGHTNGQQSHDIPAHISKEAWDRMIADNVRKSEMPHEEQLIAAYWKGWREGRGLQ